MAQGNLRDFQSVVTELDGLGQDLRVEATCVVERDGSRRWLWTVILKNLTVEQVFRLRATSDRPGR